MVTWEAIRVIAELCKISAGDNPSMTNMAILINEEQAECQGFLAECYKDKTMTECLIARSKKLNEWKNKQK